MYILIELVSDLKAKWSILRFSAIFACTGNSKRKRFAKRENKERIMGSWENEVSVTVLVKSFTEFRGV